jgi:hypothetical protein
MGFDQTTGRSKNKECFEEFIRTIEAPGDSVSQQYLSVLRKPWRDSELTSLQSQYCKSKRSKLDNKTETLRKRIIMLSRFAELPSS